MLPCSSKSLSNDEKIPEDQERLLEGLQVEKPTIELASRTDEEDSWRNLPNKGQLLLISLCRLSTALSDTCLLPYLYHIVRSILAEPDRPSASQEISRLTGLLVAAYPVGQVLTSMLWGRLSDNHGRKPVILLGLLVSVIANFAFGFSKSISMLLFWRCVAGMANGMLGVMRTMTAETAKVKKYRMRAFLAPPVVFSIGRVVALAVGGCLADPVRNLPSLFGPDGMFKIAKSPEGVAWMLRYPYSLPAMFNGMVLSFCLLLAFLGLRETLPSGRDRRDIGLVVGQAVVRFVKTKILCSRNKGYSVLNVEETDAAPPSSASASPVASPGGPHPLHHPAKRIWTAHMFKTLVAFALQPLHNSTFLHIFPVFLSMPTSANTDATIFRFSGGLGLSPPTVGLYLATLGMCGIILQLFIYPRLQKRLGTLGTLRLANAVFPVVYIIAPYLLLLFGNDKARWPAMAVVLFLQVMARTAAIPSTVLLLTEASIRKSALGTVHGAGNTFSGLASAMGPLVGGALLAWGIDHNAIGAVWWHWMCSVAVVAYLWSCLVLGDVEGSEEKE